MSKKVVFFFAAVLFFSSCRCAFASLTINEIMYDMSGSDSASGKSREWIEVYNPDSADVSVDASKWRIYDGANHTINGGDNFSIPAGAYVIFAGDKDTFLADNPNFTGTVYDTGISSLNNTGATLKILDQDANAIDTVTYDSTQGGAGDGNSLQKIGGSWAGALPTPGVANGSAASSPTTPPSNDPASTTSNASGSTTTNDNSSVSTASSGGASSSAAPVQKIKTHITGKTVAFAGVPLVLQAWSTGLGGEKLYYGKYYWNFGDGDSKEIKLSDPQQFTHTYLYPGEYVLSLQYYTSEYTYSDNPDATDTITVKVVPADIAISRVGDDRDFFIELTNNTVYEADISGWMLSSATKQFTFPKDTIVGSKKKMTIASSLTHFTVQDKSTLKLITREGKVISDYANSATPISSLPQPQPVVVKPVKKLTPEKVSDAKVDVVKNEIEPVTPVQEVPIQDLGATAVSSEGAQESTQSPYMWPLVGLAFIGASSGAVYSIRRKKKIVPKAGKMGNDFKILDE